MKAQDEVLGRIGEANKCQRHGTKERCRPSRARRMLNPTQHFMLGCHIARLRRKLYEY